MVDRCGSLVEPWRERVRSVLVRLHGPIGDVSFKVSLNKPVVLQSEACKQYCVPVEMGSHLVE